MPFRLFSGSRDTEAAQRAIATCEIVSLRSHFKLERLVATDSEKAVMLWELYPGEKVTTWQILRQGGLVSMLYAVPIFKWAALVKLGSALDEHKVAFEKEHGSFLYVFAIAALPPEQNKGLGSSLLRFITARADELGLAAFLEATSEGSKRLYERHGFKTFATYQLPQKPSPFTIYIMSRPAANPAPVT